MKANLVKLPELERAVIASKAPNTTAYLIMKYLQMGEIEAAANLFSHDGDKLYSYPELKNAVIAILGCRIHNKHNCTGRFCKA
jgi:hypothetical protein